MPAMLRDWDLCCGLQTLTKSVSPAACFKATDESHRTSSATAVAATKVQSSSFQASSLSIGVMDEDLFLMVRSGVCSDGGGTTRNMFLALHKVVLRIRKRKSLLEEVDKILEAQI
nr:uncharacterized protein LOC112754880 isoform X1 [Arachis hypogaea]